MKFLNNAAATVLALTFLASSAHAAHWEFAGWHGGGCYPALEPDPSVEGRLYLSSDVAGIWRSDDRGENWKQVNKGLGNLHVASLAVAPSDSNVVYAATKGGLYYSEDAGAEWTMCGDPADGFFFRRPYNYRSVAVSPADAGRVAAGTFTGELYYYPGGEGKSWRVLRFRKQPFSDPGPITAVVWTRGEDSLYVAAKRGLAKFSFETDTWEFFKDAPQDITDLLVLGDKAPHTVLAAGGDRLHVSLDGGKTWAKGKRIPEGKIFRLTASGSGPTAAVFAAWNEKWKGGLLLTWDFGATWEDPVEKHIADVVGNPTRAWAGSKGRNNALQADPFNPAVLYRTDWWGVWRSDDGGVTWREKIRGAPNTVCSDVKVGPDGAVYVATMDNGLLRSRDGGKNYELLFPKDYKEESSGHVWRVLIGKEGRILATASTWDGGRNQVVISEDGGKTFQSVTQGLPKKRPLKNTMWEEGYPRAFAADPKDPEVFYLGLDGDDGGGFFISRNGGRQWTPPEKQPGSKRVYNALIVDPANPKRLFWGAYGDRGGVWRSEDGGLTWKHVFKDMEKVFDLAIAPDGTIYAGGTHDGPCLYVSTDHGGKWKLSKRFGDKGTCEALAVDPRDPRTLVTSVVRWDDGADEGIFLTRDAGKSWKEITGDLPEGRGAAAMAFAPDGTLYAARYAGSVYKTAVFEE